MCQDLISRFSLVKEPRAEKNKLYPLEEILLLCIVTIDAMGCQRAIAEKIVAKGADYILAVKDNQPQLHEALQDYFETAQAANFEQVPVSYFEETDAGHGRCEVRRHWLVNDLSTLPEPEQWAKLRSIGMVESQRHEGEKTSQERRYYITTLVEDAKVFGNAVRAHWGVENQPHWALDVVFREDESRIRRDNAPANFNTLRQFSLNLLKRSVPSMSVRQKKFRAGLDDGFRAKVLFGQ